MERLLFAKSEFGKVPTDLFQKPEEIKRDKTRVISYRVPHNTAVQIFNFTTESGRIVFGPELVLLGPDEELTMISLSAGVPKVGNSFQTLYR
eukprot:UN17323